MRCHPAIAVLLLLLWAPTLLAQNCCMPKLESDDGSTEQLVEGIQSATVLLMIVPTLLVLGIGVWIFRTQRLSPTDNRP